MSKTVILTRQQAEKEFMSQLNDVSRAEGMTNYDGLCFWLELSARALHGRALKATDQQDRWRDNEDKYLAGIGRLRNSQQSANGFAAMLGIIAAALREDKSDFLGGIFSEIAASSGLGQFFTPPSLSSLMAQMTIPDPVSELDKLKASGRQCMLLSEPACGVGGMVLATNQYFEAKGVNISNEVHWDCVDVDIRAVRAAYIQLEFTKASAIIRHGNTLTLEFWDHFITSAALLNENLDSYYEDSEQEVAISA